MIWFLAASYVVAGWLLVAGVSVRTDRGLWERISGEPRRRSATSRVGQRVAHSRALGGLAGAIIGLSAWRSGFPVTSAVVVVLTVAGWRLPDLALARRQASRRSRASAAVPDLLDLVAVSVTAGLSPRLALERAPDAVGGPLGEELARASRTVSLGASWRSGLRESADRVGLPELRRLALVLERSQRLGAPVADRLRELAREVRADRRLRQEERARRAPVVMLFPLVFLILPAFILAAVIPALLVATGGLP
jgi:tight adherence protein C